MKKLIFFSKKQMLLFVFSNFCSLFLMCQKLNIQSELLKKDTIKIKESVAPQMISLKVTVDKPVDTLKVNVSLKEGLAADGKDFSLNKTNIKKLNKDDSVLIIDLIIMADELNEPTEGRLISLETVVEDKAISKYIYLEIIDDDSIAPSKYNYDDTNRTLTYLNAANFDFKNTKNELSYVFHLNLFAPNVTPQNRFGFNAGVLKINYQNNDSLISKGPAIEYLARKVEDSFVVGQKYRREVNEYFKKVSNKDWSFYFQPFFWVNKNSSSPNHFFLHAHAELLVSEWSIDNGYTTLNFDTITYNPIASPYAMPTSSPIYKYKKTYSNKFKTVSGNFGVGFTYRAKPFRNSIFFIQTTIGYTTLPLLGSSFNEKTSINNDRPERYNPSIELSNKFYLIRAYYLHQISTNAQLIVGFDSRGYLKNYQPKYVSYVGLNVNLEVLGNIFK